MKATWLICIPREVARCGDVGLQGEMLVSCIMACVLARWKDPGRLKNVTDLHLELPVSPPTRGQVALSMRLVLNASCQSRAPSISYSFQSEAHFFEPYVEGDMAAFLRYLDVKRRNAVWGDDPEVQALCEIYDRPAEIWAYDPQVTHLLEYCTRSAWRLVDDRDVRRLGRPHESITYARECS